jgi:hypothetical protein
MANVKPPPNPGHDSAESTTPGAPAGSILSSVVPLLTTVAETVAQGDRLPGGCAPPVVAAMIPHAFAAHDGPNRPP